MSHLQVRRNTATVSISNGSIVSMYIPFASKMAEPSSSGSLPAHIMLTRGPTVGNGSPGIQFTRVRPFFASVSAHSLSVSGATPSISRRHTSSPPTCTNGISSGVASVQSSSKRSATI